MAFGPRLDGLPRRVQNLPLFRAAQSHSPAGRSEGNSTHHRDLPPRQARRRPSAPLWRSSPWNRSGSHAQLSPAICRVDTGSFPALGRIHRATDRRSGDRNPCQSPTSRTGLSNMPGCASPVSRYRTQSGRSCISTRCRDRWAELQEHCVALGQPQSRTPFHRTDCHCRSRQSAWP